MTAANPMDQPAEVTPSPARRVATYESNIATVAKGGGITFAGQMFLAASRLVTTVLLARVLGAEQYGQYNLALSAANIGVGLAVFGLDAALVRYVAVLAGRRDDRGLWGALQVGLSAAMLLSVLTGTGLYALSFYLAEAAFHDVRLAPLLQMAGVIVPILTLSELLAGAVRGFKRMDYPAIAQFVAQPLIRLVLIVALSFSGLDAGIAIITFGLADLVASFILLYYLNRLFPLRRPVRAARRDIKEILTFSLPVWLSGLMVNFHSNMQTLLIGSLSSITGVGIFSIANQITIVSGQFSSSINTSAKPVVAELHDQGNLKQLGGLYAATNKWSLLVQIPVFLTMMIFPETLLAIFGESYTGGATALMILALADLTAIGTGMGGIIIDMTGYTRLKLVNSIVRLALYLALDLLFIPRWGLIGAAAVVLVGESAVSLLRLLEVYVLFRLIPYNWSFFKPFLAGGMALACALIVKWSFSAVNEFVLLLAGGGALFGVYAGVLWLLGFSPEEQMLWANVRRRILKVVGKNA